MTGATRAAHGPRQNRWRFVRTNRLSPAMAGVAMQTSFIEFVAISRG